MDSCQNRKSWLRVWACRVMIAVDAPLAGIALYLLSVQVERYAFFLPPLVVVLLLIPSMLLLVPSVWMVSNLIAFPWNYSVFGWHRRTRPPDEAPYLSKICPAWPGYNIGGPLNFARLQVFPTGLAISLPPVLGKAFIPLEHFARLQQRRRTITPLYAFKLYHTCPEIRSPLRFSSAKVFDVLVRLMEHRDRERYLAQSGGYPVL